MRWSQPSGRELIEGWRRRPGPTTSPVPAGPRCRSAGTKPPTSRTHRGAPAEDRRIASDAADGHVLKSGTGAKAQVHVSAIVLNAGRTWRAGDKRQSAGTIRQDTRAIVPNGEWSSHDLGTGPPFELQSDAVVLQEEHGTGQRARIRDAAV